MTLIQIYEPTIQKIESPKTYYASNVRRGEGGLVAAAMVNGGDGAFGRSRGRETRGREGMRERREVRGVRGDVQGVAEQAGRQEVVGRVAAAGCGAGTHLLGRGGEDDRGAGGLGRLLAGPACCCWAAQGRAPGKLLLFFLFLFSNFSDIVLI